ncbi:MAG: DOMON-like domain-containing protein [Hyphomonadaceae bacterium]|nr:DOMON-like domain-containing protein [Hyphomonadaceae bacterium]
MKFSLAPHPTTNPDAISAVAVEIARLAPDQLALRYEVEGDIARLLAPAPAHPERTDELWKHTCFEAFLMTPAGGGYLECNLSPSSQWAVYAFDAYREGMRAAEGFSPAISIESSAERFALSATLRGPALARGGPLALCAVIEETDGRKSYWALRHPLGKPDFHHPDCFAAELGASERS